MILDNLHNDYISAEITWLVLHEKVSKEYFNLLTIIELIPSEQKLLPKIGNSETYWCDRINLDDNYSILITRFEHDVHGAIEIFKNFDKGADFGQGRKLKVFDNQNLKQEPNSEQPILLSSESSTSLSKILPKRNTLFRVWSQLDIQKTWLNNFDTSIKAKSDILTEKYLNFKISELHEHFGNVYLCASNPILRNYTSSLIDGEKKVLFRFYERENKSIKNCTLVVEEERGGNIGFSLSQKITSNNVIVELPHNPGVLITRFFDSSNNIIGYKKASFLTMLSLSMQVQSAELILTIKKGENKKTHKISKNISLPEQKIGSNNNIENFLQIENNKRKYIVKEKNKEFIFFAHNDKDKAKKTIHELLNKAEKKCMILDPYFGAADLEYVYLIKNMSVPIEIISSVSFLKSKIQTQKQLNKFKKIISCLFPVRPKGDIKKTNSFFLQKAIMDFQKILPEQTIQCKVLKGNKSPLHDRYIIIDDTVYLLGSSLNEFGSRATTLVKVPTPEKMIKQANNWWTEDENNDGAICISLDKYIKDKQDAN